MKITRLDLRLLRVPLRTPFRTALRTVQAVEDIVVAVQTDSGHVGYGEAPPTPQITGETHASIVSSIRARIAPLLMGREVAELNDNTAIVQSALTGNTSAKAAVEIALYDLWAQLHGAPLFRILGGNSPELTTDLTISVDGIDKMVADARHAVDGGFRALKVKLGKDARLDVERVRQIHAAVGDRASLRLDANQGWSPEQAVSVVLALEDAGIPMELIEQPVPASDVDGLKYVADRVRTPVMADEAVFGPLQAIDLIQRGAADILNIKLMKAGGISNAIRIADIAALHGVQCMIGCMLESSISVSAAAHLAAAKSSIISKVDLDGPALTTFDPVEGGTRFDGPLILLSTAPGLGIDSIRDLEPLPESLGQA